MLAGSNTSVRYSTVPEIPAGVPVAVKHSVMENDKSIRAVWVSIGRAVARTSPSAGSAGDEFCQPNMTCTSGCWAKLRVALRCSTRTSNGTSWCS